MIPWRVAGARSRQAGARHRLFPLAMILLLFSSLTQVATSEHRARPDENLAARFLTEAPQGWERVGLAARHLQGNARQMHFDLMCGREESADRRVEVRICQGQKWAAFSGNDAQTRKFHARAVNTKYGFEADGPTESSLRVVDITLAPWPREPPNDPLSLLLKSIRGWTCDSLCLVDRHLPDLIRDPGFKLKHVSVDPTSSNSNAIRVEYDFSPPVERYASILGGVFRVDPARDWVLLDYRIEYYSKAKGKGSVSGLYEYDNGNASTPVLRRLSYEMKTTEPQSGSTPVHFERIREFNLQFTDDVPERACTLSAFGLEEPFGVEWPKPTPWFLYFSAGGFGLFFLAVFLWRVLAKRQARGVS
jgi:hypothetical protein